jgi:hypothetical protein
MRKASIVFVVVLFLAECFGQQADHTNVTVSGCVVNINGSFKLLTHSRTYVLRVITASCSATTACWLRRSEP